MQGLQVQSVVRELRSHVCCCSLAKSHLTLCNPMSCSMPGFLFLLCFPGFAQTHVLWVCDAIQPSHPLSLPSPTRCAAKKKERKQRSLDSLLTWLCKCLSGCHWPAWPWTPNAAVWTTDISVSGVAALAFHLLPIHILGRWFLISWAYSIQFGPNCGEGWGCICLFEVIGIGQALVVWDPPNQRGSFIPCICIKKHKMMQKWLPLREGYVGGTTS